MATFAATIFFEDRKSGWSETWWHTSDGYDTTLRKLQNLADARIRLCGKGIISSYLRVSDVDVFRDARVDITFNRVAQSEGFVPGGKGSTQIGVIVPWGNPDRPYSALLVRVQNTAKYWGLRYLRGIPDDVITDPDGPTFLPGYAEALQAYFAQLKGGWLMRVRSHEGDVFKQKRILGINTVGGVAQFFLPNHGFIVGQTISLSRVKTQVKVNGLHIVANTGFTADTFELEDIKGPLLIGALPINGVIGYAAAYSIIYVPVLQAEVRGQTHRDSGRPFDSPHGRRAVRR